MSVLGPGGVILFLSMLRAWAVFNCLISGLSFMIRVLVRVRIWDRARVTVKLGFHIRGKRKRHALCVIRQKWQSM